MADCFDYFKESNSLVRNSFVVVGLCPWVICEHDYNHHAIM